MNRCVVVNYDLLLRTIIHLRWLIDERRYQKRLTGLNDEDSAELKDAEKLFKEIVSLFVGDTLGPVLPN